jgi:hypothetical protein
MIIKQGEFVGFAPAELHSRKAAPAPRRALKAATTEKQPKPEVPASRSDLLQEVERLIRANERLTLERDQLREELSRQSLEARRTKRLRTKPKPVNENLRHQPLEPAPVDHEVEPSEPIPNAEMDDPGFELARVVVNWFWEDADEASVRLVHDALSGQGIRTLVRDTDTEAE